MINPALSLRVPSRLHVVRGAAAAPASRGLPLWWELSQRAGALLTLVALAPLLVALWIAVRGSSRGPFLFRQSRPGRDGRTFSILKIRTMTLGSESRTALGVTRRNPAITRVGRVLRLLKLDELPQLWNVVRGDMRVVGPRPVPEALHRHLAEHIPGFDARTRCKPGLTNLSQVCLDDNAVGDRLLDDWRRRSEGEAHYFAHASVAYDLVVIALTAFFVTRRVVRMVRPPRVPGRVLTLPGRARTRPAPALSARAA